MEQNTTRNHLFPFMGTGSLIYAFFITLLLYKNHSGITYPFFVGGTCLFFCLFLKKSGITAKKDIGFYMAGMMLLGISTCLTDSFPLLFFNKLLLFLLFFCMMLHCFYEDGRWDLTRYLAAVFHLITTSLSCIMHPLFDFLDYRRIKKSAPENSMGRSVLFGILIAVPLLFMILLLLSSADAIFANLFSSFLDHFFNLMGETKALGILFFYFFAFFAAYCIMAGLKKRNFKEECPDKRTTDPVIAITFTSVISAVYLIFCLIQIIFLFAGAGALPKGYTYAEYARQGFFQLVFVCLLNLSLVLFCIKYFRAHPVLKGILTFICGCTYIMTASSAYRMLLYISVYQLTFLRIFVLFTLLVIFLLMAGVCVLIYRESFPYFRYSLITVTVLYLLFSFAHPDYWIADYNISRMNDTHFDEAYISHLSADAAPCIYTGAEEYGYEEEGWFKAYARKIWNSHHQQNLVEKPLEDISLRKWNLSRWRAEKYYESSSFF